jgi:hypothetical protein
MEYNSVTPPAMTGPNYKGGRRRYKTRRSRGGDENYNVNDAKTKELLDSTKRGLRPAPALPPRDTFGKIIRGQARKTRRNRKRRAAQTSK